MPEAESNRPMMAIADRAIQRKLGVWWVSPLVDDEQLALCAGCERREEWRACRRGVRLSDPRGGTVTRSDVSCGPRVDKSGLALSPVVDRVAVGGARPATVGRHRTVAPVPQFSSESRCFGTGPDSGADDDTDRCPSCGEPECGRTVTAPGRTVIIPCGCEVSLGTVSDGGRRGASVRHTCRKFYTALSQVWM